MEYKLKIIEMINEINTEKFLKLIYGFVCGAYREESAVKRINDMEERGALS